MSISDVANADPVKVVFIDSRVPDIQALIDGAAPGERVFVLDSSSDGIQQIANVLANDDLTNLSSISIVGHGASGEIELGSSWIDDSDLANHSTALSTIGAALAPGGDLALYACDTAQGPAGQQFITDLSHYAGGVDVAASTHLVGSADHGGSWTLDASTGVADASTPFTASTLADFQGELAAQPTSQIWFGADRDTLTGNTNPFGFINSDGSSRTQVGESPSDGSGQTSITDIALDPTAGLYFGLNQGEAATQNVHLVVGHTSGGAPISSSLLLNANDYVIQGITADPQNHFIYIGVWGDGQADSGIIKLSYNPTTGVVNNGQPIVSGSVISPSYFIPTNGAAFTNPKDLYLDVGAQKIYFAANDLSGSGPFGGGFTDTNGIYVTNLATGTTTELSLPSQFPATAAGAALSISALTINTTTGMIYFATEDESNDLGAQHSTIWQMPIGGGTATQMTLPTPVGFVSPGGLAYDADSNRLIVSDGGDTLHSPAIDPAIYSFSLNTGGTAFTGSTVLAHGDQNSSDPTIITRGIALDELAHIGTLTGTTNQALQGASSPLFLLGATPTGITDPDNGGFLASASVKISNAQAGDLIGIGTNFSFNTTPQTIGAGGGSFSVSFDASTHTLTIANASGTENTYAEYEALLAQISFKDTGTDASTGAHPTRTIVWQVNDGAVGNPVGADNVATTTIVIDRAPSATADTNTAVAGGVAVLASVIGNDTDLDGDTLTVSGFTVGGSTGTLGTVFHGTYGDLTLNGNGSYSYSAGATGAEQTALANAPAGSHPTEVISYTVSDGNGGTSTSTLTITIDRAPNAVADTGNALDGGTATTGNVLTNDTDQDGDPVTVTGFTDGTAGSLGAVFHGTYGDLILNSNGSYSYTAGATGTQQTALDNAPTGSHPTETVTYTVSDGHGGTSTSTLTVTIDRAPVATADTDSASSGGAAAVGNVLTNDTDKDGDTLSVTGLTDGTAGTIGSVFHGTYGDITLNANGSYTYTAGATGTQQSAIAGAGGHANEVITYTESDGHGGTATSTLTIDVSGAPTIASIATSGTGITAGNGDLDAGNVVTLTVDMSTAVTVDTTNGTPTLLLNDGGTATYTGGSGSNALTFTYTVQPGENTADLAVSSVALNGGTIRDGNSQDANFSGAIPAPAGTLQIDTTAPTITAVATSGTGIVAGNGDLDAGHTVTFTVSTSEVVLVDTSGGTPTLLLSNGQTATYSGGSGSNALTFTYTVTAGHDTADLAVSSLNLNGGSVHDAAGNAANVSGAATNPAGALQIDTTAPTVTSVATSGTGITAGTGDLGAGATVTFTVNTSEVVLVDTSGGTPTLLLSNGQIATYSGGSGSNALTFTYTVTAGHDTADLAVSSVSLNGGSAHDAAGNNADFSGAATNPPGTLQIDTTAPTVTSVATSGTGITAGNGDLDAGHVVTFTVNTSEAVIVDTSGGTPTLLLSNGQTATYTGGSGGTALTFTYTVTPGHDTADLGVSSVSLNGASMHDAAGNAANLSGATANPTGTLQIDTTAPTVTSVVTSGTGITAGNGDLDAGHTVTFTVNTSEAVLVDTSGGTPTLLLSNGQTATYTGGSGGTALTFTYTVTPGHDTADLAVSSVSLNGGSVHDAAGNAADLSAAATNPAGTLQIDTTAPTITSVATSGPGITAGNGDLGAGQTVTFTVSTSEAVLVDTSGGTPTLTLSNGQTATYTGGSGSNALTFTYTVTAGHDTPDLAVSSLNLNGGSVHDAAGNAANLGGAATNPAGTLQIDTATPSVTSVTTSGIGITAGTGDLDAGHTVTFTVSTSEVVLVDTSGGTPTLTLSNGQTATYSGGTGTTALTFTYTVTPGHDTADLAVSSVSLNGGSVHDAAGNAADLSGAAINPAGVLQIDTTAPTVTSVATSGTGITAGNGDLDAGHTVTFTVNTSEAVLVDTSGGTPTLLLSNGQTATYTGGSGTTALTFTYTVTPGHDTADLGVSSVSLNGGSVHDAAGNAANLSGAAANPAGTLQIDTTAPTITAVATSGTGIIAGNGDLDAGHVVTFTVSTSEAVLVDTSGGTPTLLLSNGQTATYTGGSGSNALTFTYTVTPGHDTPDLAVSSLNLNGGSVHDAAGNAADLSGAATNPAGALQIDTTAPTITSVATSGTGITAGNGDLNAGHTVIFTVNTSEAVLVDTSGGTPTLILSNGQTATYTGGSGSNALTFSYTVTPGHDTPDLAVSSLSLNGGSVHDAAGNAAILGGAATNPAGTLQIDTATPSVSSVTTSGAGITAGTGDLDAGHVVTFTVNTSEAVIVDTSGGTPTLVLSNGQTATYTGGSGSTALTFTYTVTSGHDTADLAVSSVSLNGGSVHDAAGNPANLSGAATNPAGTLQIDTTAPTVAVTSDHSTLTAGGSALVTFTFSEAVAGFTLGDVTASGGSLSNLVHVGVDGQGHDVYTSTFTPTVTNTEHGSVQVNGASYADPAGNAGTASNTVTFTGDTQAPHLTGATANPSSGTEVFNSVVVLTLAFDEAMQIAAGTTLSLNDGGTATYDSAATALLHDPTKAVFDYTVGAGDSSTSALAITGVSHGSISDLAGNTATGVNATFPGLSVEASLITANPDSNHATPGQTLTVGAAQGVLVNDTDTNPSDHLVVSAVDGSAAGVDHVVAGHYGSLTLHADGSYSYTANATSNGYLVDSFTYTASNGHSPTSTTTLSISVVGGNYAYVQVPPGGSGTTGTGNTILDGSAGHATLTAASTFNAHEILVGGPGDILNAGNSGQDVFVFNGDFGQNTINNFHTALDSIQLLQSQFGTITNVLADLHEDHGNAVLTLDPTHVITITNIQVASLTASNFHLV